jgi:hypothetical protein
MTDRALHLEALAVVAEVARARAMSVEARCCHVTVWQTCLILAAHF